MLDYAATLGACARGDRGALKQLYDEEAGRLIGIAQRIVRRRELAEEVVQDAFIQIWRKADSFDPGLGSARGWIYAVVRHRALNMIRDGAREDLVDSEDLDHVRDLSTEVADTFERLSADSACAAVWLALEQEKRESILLAYVSGCSHGEIAALLRVPLGTAKSWVRRGLLALRDVHGVMTERDELDRGRRICAGPSRRRGALIVRDRAARRDRERAQGADRAARERFSELDVTAPPSELPRGIMGADRRRVGQRPAAMRMRAVSYGSRTDARPANSGMALPRGRSPPPF